MIIALNALDTSLRIIVPFLDLEPGLPSSDDQREFNTVDLIAEHLESAALLAVLDRLDTVLVLEVLDTFLRYVTV
jgi:hypothetical protein